MKCQPAPACIPAHRCVYCKAPTNREPEAKICWKCMEAREPIQTRAYRAVRQAVADGRLPNILAKLCTDCGAPARDWDHRSYERPLAVEPVCRSCNLRRGPATWLPSQEAAA